jgi:hypothetical protein
VAKLRRGLGVLLAVRALEGPQVSGLTDEQRETLGDCTACMAAKCSVCGHEPCPVCADDCDNYDCIEWSRRGTGRKKHACIFARCPEHQALGVAS